ncbi:hypothetical protein ABPG72_016107 [Tetrahymena utriculariae]
MNEQKDQRRSKISLNLKGLALSQAQFAQQILLWSRYIQTHIYTPYRKINLPDFYVMLSVQVMMNRSAEYPQKLLLLKLYCKQEFQYYYDQYKKEITQNMQLNEQHYDTYLKQQCVNRNNQTLLILHRWALQIGCLQYDLIICFLYYKRGIQFNRLQFSYRSSILFRLTLQQIFSASKKFVRY